MFIFKMTYNTQIWKLDFRSFAEGTRYKKQKQKQNKKQKAKKNKNGFVHMFYENSYLKPLANVKIKMSKGIYFR